MPATPPELLMPKEQPQQRHEPASGSGHQPAPAAQPASAAQAWLDALAALPSRDSVISPTDRMMAGSAGMKDDIEVTKDEPPTPFVFDCLGNHADASYTPCRSSPCYENGTGRASCR